MTDKSRDRSVSLFMPYVHQTTVNVQQRQRKEYIEKQKDSFAFPSAKRSVTSTPSLSPPSPMPTKISSLCRNKKRNSLLAEAEDFEVLLGAYEAVHKRRPNSPASRNWERAVHEHFINRKIIQKEADVEVENAIVKENEDSINNSGCNLFNWNCTAR